MLCLSKQTSQPKLDVFQELLNKHPDVFHPSRTPKSLLVHWQLLKQYYLLDDQSGEFIFPEDRFQIPIYSLVIKERKLFGYKISFSSNRVLKMSMLPFFFCATTPNEPVT